LNKANIATYLVVNADDFAYFPEVSQGILDAHRDGIVTATGILANGTSFDEDVGKLRSASSIDAGVHLNLTFGEPLTLNMRDRLANRKGHFATKGGFAQSYLLGRISTKDVEIEWRAQIERCYEAELKLWFLNSHEHVHLFPGLFNLVQELAEEYEVPYIRLPTARLFESLRPIGLVRAGIVKILGAANRRSLRMPEIHFVGFGQSGCLSEEYLAQLIRTLEPGKIYELMCHPGYDIDDKSEFAHLHAYHHWDREFQSLTSLEIQEICSEQNVNIIGYRDIERIGL
jgi:predicted glycoside hydrolase/deacetylase ChbG (UPF0249 family)